MNQIKMKPAIPSQLIRICLRSAEKALKPSRIYYLVSRKNLLVITHFALNREMQRLEIQPTNLSIIVIVLLGICYIGTIIEHTYSAKNIIGHPYLPSILHRSLKSVRSIIRLRFFKNYDKS